MKDIDKDKFKTDINSELILTSTNNIKAHNFNTILRNILDKHAPLKDRKISNRPTAKWFNLEIKSAKRLRRSRERRWRKSGLEIHKQIFNKQRLAVNILVEQTKRDYYLQRFGTIQSCKELFFFTVNEVFQKKTSGSLPQGQNKELAQNFSSFFKEKIDIITTELESLSPPSPSYNDFNGAPLGQFTPACEEEIKEIIIKSASKSCDLDPIPTDLLKYVIDELLPYITVIVNDSLSSGEVPDCFKNAIIKPILKKSWIKRK